MRVDFTGRTVLVTGGSRGIGARIASDVVACGADLIVTSTSDLDDATRKELGPAARHVKVDFTNPHSCSEFYAYVRGLDKLDVCINNAGVARHGPVEDATEDYWDHTSDVNLKAPFFVTQAAASVMKKGRYGRVVNIGSIWSHMTREGRAIYTGTKFGLRGLTMSFANELGSDNILVNMVAPGPTVTDMMLENYSAEERKKMAENIPVGRLATTEDISNATLFLASELNSYVNGQSLVLDGGYGVAR